MEWRLPPRACIPPHRQSRVCDDYPSGIASLPDCFFWIASRLGALGCRSNLLEAPPQTPQGASAPSSLRADGPFLCAGCPAPAPPMRGHYQPMPRRRQRCPHKRQNHKRYGRTYEAFRRGELRSAIRLSCRPPICIRSRLLFAM